MALAPLDIFSFVCLAVGGVLILGGFVGMIHWGMNNRKRKIQKNYHVNKSSSLMKGGLSGRRVHDANEEDSFRNLDVEAFEHDHKKQSQRDASLAHEGEDMNGNDSHSRDVLIINDTKKDGKHKKKKEKAEKQKKVNGVVKETSKEKREREKREKAVAITEAKEKKEREKREKEEKKERERREKEEEKQRKKEKREGMMVKEEHGEDRTLIGGTVLGMGGEAYSNVGESQTITTNVSDYDSAQGESPQLGDKSDDMGGYMEPRSVTPDSLKAGSFHHDDSAEEGYLSGHNDYKEPEIVPQQAILLYDDDVEEEGGVSVHSERDEYSGREEAYAPEGSHSPQDVGYDNEAYQPDTYEMAETHQLSDHDNEDQPGYPAEEQVPDDHESDRDHGMETMATTAFITTGLTHHSGEDHHHSESSSSHQASATDNILHDRHNSGSTSRDFEAASPLPDDADATHTVIEDDISHTQVYNYDDHVNDNTVGSVLEDDPPSERSDRSFATASQGIPTPPVAPPLPPPLPPANGPPSSFSTLSHNGNKLNENYAIPLRQDALDQLQNVKAGLKKTPGPGGFKMQMNAGTPIGSPPDETHANILKEFMGKLKRRNGGPKIWEIEAQQAERIQSGSFPSHYDEDSSKDEQSTQEEDFSQRSDVAGSQISATENADAYKAVDDITDGADSYTRDNEYAQSDISGGHYTEDPPSESTPPVGMEEGDAGMI